MEIVGISRECGNPECGYQHWWGLPPDYDPVGALMRLRAERSCPACDTPHPETRIKPRWGGVPKLNPPAFRGKERDGGKVIPLHEFPFDVAGPIKQALGDGAVPLKIRFGKSHAGEAASALGVWRSRFNGATIAGISIEITDWPISVLATRRAGKDRDYSIQYAEFGSFRYFLGGDDRSER